ncbi:response regulator transcription factor [Amycolatopsis sp. NPDC049868]|uniref:response regulator transcription factor n=1 Tax=Amycolatopsis sp. NPDC049868 TaxID=3363934 RepID=UPI0037AB96E4
MSRHEVVDDRPEIYRALIRMRQVTGLPLAFGGEITTDRRVKLSQIAGTSTGALRGVTLEYGRGLGGKAVAVRRPVVVNDYVRSPGISHHYDHIIVAEELRAMVAVPVVVGRTVRGVLYGALRSSVPLGDLVVQSVVEAARDLEQSLAVRDEVTRRLSWLARNDASASDRPQWELVREAYTELRVISQRLDDAVVRQQVRMVCDKLATVGGGRPRRDSTPALSTRELDVLACVALGWTNAQVAEDLGITMETVKSYLRSAMRKLVARSRMEAVVTARRFGLLP